MSFNTNTPDPQTRQAVDKIALAISCLRQGRNAQAFLLLSAQGLERAPAAQFALGLCHLRAEALAKAIACFEQALSILKAASAPRESPPADDTYVTLVKKQIKAEIYLEPMDAEFCIRFPQVAEQNILLALIYVYRKNGMEEQARRIAAGLIGTEFAEYRKTL